MQHAALPRAHAANELLLGLARTVQSTRTTDRIRTLLSGNVDWTALLQMAAWHKVIPLLYRSLQGQFAGQTPAEILASLHHHYTLIGRRNLHLAAELAALTAFLRTHGIHAIAYKGPTIALLAYRDLHLRQFGDLDVLVSGNDYARTRELLMARAYRPDVDWGWESSFVDDSKGLCIDLHREITPDIFPARLAWADIRQRLITIRIAGRDIDTLNAEDMLLVLCVQLAKDTWGENALRLSKLCDIAELLRSTPELDLEAVFQASRRAGCRRIFHFALLAAHELLEAPVAERLLSRARGEKQIEALLAHLRGKLLGQREQAYVPALSAPDFHFMARERWRDRFHPHYLDLAYHLKPNEKDREFLPVPDSLHFLYYLIRPVRVARDHIRRLIKGSEHG